jgi:hypothetical protein
MDTWVPQILSMLGYQLPLLLASVIALVMLWSGARAGLPRTLGLSGIGLILLTELIRLALALLQVWLMRPDAGRDYTDMQSVFQIVSIVHILLSLLFSGGLVLIVWGLCKATYATAPVADHSR